ncbi:MAG: hypothetical protein ACI8PZ_003832 [Myxococcota bacterium]|jgi:hypothetical protein
MFRPDRFESALDALDALADEAFALRGTVSVAMERLPFNHPTDPHGPGFVVYTKRPKAFRRAQRAGPQRAAVRTDIGENLPVRVAKARFGALGHKTVDNPVRPGSSIGGKGRQNAGTFGAVVRRGTEVRILTAGHVVGKPGTVVVQPGESDQGRNPLGTVDVNAEPTKGLDAATLTPPQGSSITSKPHDQVPQPSRRNPAVGLAIEKFLDKGPVVAIDMATALTGTLTTLPNRIAKPMIGQSVEASGRTSGRLVGKITKFAKHQQLNGFPTLVMYIKTGKEARRGDSGAVFVAQTSGTVYDPDTGTIEATDVDNVEEWLPGNFIALDDFVGGRSTGRVITKSGVKGNVKTLAKAQTLAIARKIRAYFKRLLGDLDVVVDTLTEPVPCTPSGPRQRATRCSVRINRADGTVVERPGTASKGAEIAGEPTEDSKPCCSFGVLPVVSVSGDDSESVTFTIEVTATAGLTIKLSSKQVVTDASFLRKGSCWAGRCSKERLTGFVKLSRTTTIEISATVGQIEVPGLGKIDAGNGVFSQTSVKSLRKRFSIACTDPDAQAK